VYLIQNQSEHQHWKPANFACVLSKSKAGRTNFNFSRPWPK